MKIASTPSMGHLNPLLAIGRILIAEGREVVGLTGSALRDRIEGIGAQFQPLPASADMDRRDVPFPAELIIGEDMFFGVLPMLFGPRSQRPPIILSGTSYLHCRRKDGAAHNVGLPPPTKERDECTVIAREYLRIFEEPRARM